MRTLGARNHLFTNFTLGTAAWRLCQAELVETFPQLCKRRELAEIRHGGGKLYPQCIHALRSDTGMGNRIHNVERHPS